MTAAALLERCGSACPVDIDPEQVTVRRMPFLLRRAVGRSFQAITLGRVIYLRHEPAAVTPSGRLVRHELVHVEQWQRLGRWRFLRAYAGQYFANRGQGLGHLAAYTAMPLEIEARTLAKGGPQSSRPSQ